MNLTRDHFLNALMLTDSSYELILPEFLEQLFQKVYRGGTLQRYPNQEQLNEILDQLEEREQAFVVEIVVGKGKKSNILNKEDRPILNKTLEILDKEPRCMMYTIYQDSTVFAMFYKEKFEQEQ